MILLRTQTHLQHHVPLQALLIYFPSLFPFRLMTPSPFPVSLSSLIPSFLIPQIAPSFPNLPLYLSMLLPPPFTPAPPSLPLHPILPLSHPPPRRPSPSQPPSCNQSLTPPNPFSLLGALPRTSPPLYLPYPLPMSPHTNPPPLHPPPLTPPFSPSTVIKQSEDESVDNCPIIYRTRIAPTSIYLQTKNSSRRSCVAQTGSVDPEEREGGGGW